MEISVGFLSFSRGEGALSRTGSSNSKSFRTLAKGTKSVGLPARLALFWIIFSPRTFVRDIKNQCLRALIFYFIYKGSTFKEFAR